MSGRLRIFFDFLIFSNIFLSICVTSLVVETSLVLTNGFNDLRYPFFLFCATLFLYCFHRVYRSDFRSQEEKLSARHLWIKNNLRFFYSVLVFSALGALISAVLFVPFHILATLLPVALISIGYTIPCLPWKGKWLRLRDLPGIKVFLIALVLGLTTVLLPVLAYSSYGSLMSPAIFIIFLRRMFFIFAITIPFDIRDLEYDQRNGTRTIPVILGVTKAKAVAFFALAIFIGLALFQYFMVSNTKIEYVFALVLSALISAWMISISGKKKQDRFYSVFLEGMMLLQCLLILMASKLSL